MEVKGVIGVGESSNAISYVKGRRGISPRQSAFILLLSILAVGIPLAAWITGSWFMAALSIEAGILGCGIGILIVRLLSIPYMRKALDQRSQPAEYPVTLVLTPERLSYDVGGVTITAGWQIVTDLFPTRKHWVFLVQSSAFVIPRRFFASADAERAFIGQALSLMPPAARDRSGEAMKIAAGGSRSA